MKKRKYEMGMIRGIGGDTKKERARATKKITEKNPEARENAKI